jgi:imidazolonepropionase-like amidohydrolase
VFAASGQVPERVLAIEHTDLIDGTGGDLRTDTTIVIVDSKITQVGPSSQIAVPKGAKVIRARGMVVMPGLADMHIHLASAWDGKSPDVAHYQRYLNALLYAGVTTILDTGNFQDFILRVRGETASGKIPGPRVFCVGGMIDGARPVWPDISSGVASPKDVADVVAERKRAGVDLLKGYERLDSGLLTALVNQSRTAGMKFLLHSASRDGSLEVIGLGVVALAHLPNTAMSDEAIQLARSNGVQFLSTLNVHESFAKRRFQSIQFLQDPLIRSTSDVETLAHLRAFAGEPVNAGITRAALDGLRNAQGNARRLWDAGVLVVAGSDASYPGVFQGEGLHRELELLVEAGIPPIKAIQAASLNAARFMGQDAIWGSVTPGKRADLVVVKGKPYRTIGDTRKIVMIVQNGKIVDRNSLRLNRSRSGE